MKQSSIHPAEVLTCGGIILALLAVVAQAHGQAIETFKEFHIPARQTIDTGQSWLFNGVVVNGKTIPMNPHMAFGSLDFFNNPTSLQLVGKAPPAIHEQSIRPGDEGFMPCLWIYFDQPVSSVTFDAFPDDAVGYLYVGIVTDPFDNSGPDQYANGLNHVACNVGAPIYAIVLSWLNWFIDGSQGSFSNVEIQ